MTLLLCTDLDRTALPNGPWDASPDALPRFRRLVDRPEVHLAYVTGRDRGLIEEAIDSFGLPVPDFAIGDVGTTIYEVANGEWSEWSAWWETIGSDWGGRSHDQVAALFTDLAPLRLQPPERQSRYKMSFFADADVDRPPLFAEMARRLDGAGARSNLIWSVDELTGDGLLDVLPAGADKLKAIRFLIQRKGYDESRTVFAGDSGNDLPALTSGLQAVLVANANDETREEAVRTARSRGIEHRLYLARGDFLGMNGNYSAGILEGLAHFLPETRAWMSGDL